jgi:lysine-N-methylase
VKARKSLPVVFPPEQLFECRDCPARCCRGWAVPVSPEVAHFLISDEELRGRLVGLAPTILAGGTLPMVERDGQLQCCFLDDDLLCAVQKKHGHDALPSACQAFPFGFMKDEQQRPVAQLSRYCPSIRDNYGKPIADSIQDKLVQAGGAKPLAPRMGLKSGRTLAREQYLLVARAWREQFQGNPAQGLARAYALTDGFDERLETADASSAQVQATLERAQHEMAQSPLAAAGPGFSARLFFSHLLGSLSYPARLLGVAAARRPGFGMKLWAAWVKLCWLFGWGSAQLLHVPEPVPLGRIDRVARFLDGPLAEPINVYLRELLDRRQPFARQTYLTRVLVELAFAVALASRFARARAAAAGLAQVRPADVAEGIGIAELTLSHSSGAQAGSVLSQLELKLMSDPQAFRRFLASEV